MISHRCLILHPVTFNVTLISAHPVGATQEEKEEEEGKGQNHTGGGGRGEEEEQDKEEKGI